MTDRERELLRALIVIEGMAFHHTDDFAGHPGRAPFAGYTPEQYILNLQRIVSQAFCIAHAATGHCCKGGAGDQWVKLTERVAAELKADGTVDVDRVLSEIEAQQGARLPLAQQTQENSDVPTLG